MVMPTHWLMGYFYPRPPRGGRQTAVSTAVKGLIFLSTPSARRATDEHAHGMTTGKISIHALREEGDTTHEEGTSDETHFYPRPPRGGRPVTETRLDELTRISIHALREESDGVVGAHYQKVKDFYPRPPRGGRRRVLQYRASLEDISIHALREEGDEDRLDYYVPQFAFLSTPSARRATQTQRINEP